MFNVNVLVALLALVAYYLLYGRYVGTEKDLSLKARAEEEQIKNRKRNGKLVQNVSYDVGEFRLVLAGRFYN